MTIADRWLLPDGVEEILPPQAGLLEQQRRDLLDLFQCWGYDLVMPPLMEYLDSLLIGSGSDLDLQTFKVTDQLTGRMMGIRADMTPQVSRIDAHSLNREGPTRLCYCDSVLHTKNVSKLDSRSPIQIGAELYGYAGIEADIEVILLLAKSLKLLGMEKASLDFGHVTIFRTLIAETNLDAQQAETLFEILQRKSLDEIDQFCSSNIADSKLADMVRQLPRLNGGAAILDTAASVLASAPDPLHQALEQLKVVAGRLTTEIPEVNLYFDLGELRGYHYHTGLVFAAFAPGLGQALASGGRYDDVGQAFGRNRPATGFSIDMSRLLRVLDTPAPTPNGIFVDQPAQQHDFQDQVAKLRSQGKRVIVGLPNQSEGAIQMRCKEQLIYQNNSWVIQPVK
ncbi:MAG: ATP phosphoribosyltransferase regulatory subunit [Pseudomonadales bacterium]|nr:ATP phosphoribosyltransferase regulatory subunit [Pseudomonadales bacterium]